MILTAPLLSMSSPVKERSRPQRHYLSPDSSPYLNNPSRRRASCRRATGEGEKASSREKKLYGKEGSLKGPGAGRQGASIIASGCDPILGGGGGIQPKGKNKTRSSYMSQYSGERRCICMGGGGREKEGTVLAPHFFSLTAGSPSGRKGGRGLQQHDLSVPGKRGPSMCVPEKNRRRSGVRQATHPGEKKIRGKKIARSNIRSRGILLSR